MTSVDGITLIRAGTRLLPLNNIHRFLYKQNAITESFDKSVSIVRFTSILSSIVLFAKITVQFFCYTNYEGIDYEVVILEFYSIVEPYSRSP